jgi:hypothetical protein
MLLGRRHTISRLVALTGAGDRRAVAQVVSGVDRLSLRRGGRSHLAKLPGLVSRTLYAVRMDRALPVLAGDPLPPTTGPASFGSMAIARGLARIVTGFVGRWIDRTLEPGRWLVAVSRANPPGGADPLPEPGTFALLAGQPGIEWADPFPVTSPGRELVFLEEYLTDRHRGRLAVVELDDSPRGWRTATTILDLPTHLSYPFVFQWDGAWYLLPEQAATGSLELYRAVEFPDQWAWHSTALASVAAADATLAEIDGRWWLFAAIAGTPGAAADELHLYHATSPLGPWTAHPRNPVVSDIRTARPAGRPYRHDGQWYRPAQDGSVGYGHSIAVVRIERLDPEGYREHVAGVIGPTWLSGLIGTHTINADGQLTAIDGNRRKPRLRRPRS